MIVFNAFLKVLDKCKAPIIMYTVFLIFFGIFNMQNSENSMGFEISKPDVLIVNTDSKNLITDNLISYLKKSNNVKSIHQDADSISDALFYRDVSYVIYIPDGYGCDFSNKLNPEIKVQSTNDGEASLAKINLEKYLKVANIYNNIFDNEEEVILNINETLQNNIQIDLTTNLDTASLSKVTFYYNFLNYSLLAGAIYVICLIIASFKNEGIHKRTVISKMSSQKYNRYLMFSNSMFGLVLWLLYVLISIILFGKIMFTSHGLLYIINSFIFMICTLTIAFLIGSLLTNKNAINGIVNVIALGSSFLCGSFVPMAWLPESVLKIAHFLPSYWFIKNNELVKDLEVINLESLKLIFVNMGMLVSFIIVFIVIINIVGWKKRKIA